MSSRSARASVLVLRALAIMVFVLPLAIMITGSLRQVGLPPGDGLSLLPADPTLSSFRDLDTVIPWRRLAWNSVLVSLVAVPVTVVVASWAGFAMANLPPRSRRVLLGLTVGLLMVPLPMLWIARFVLYLKLGVLGTLLPLMAPALAATTPFTVLLAYRAFRRVPPELFQAARLEGASAVRTWWSVGVPLTTATTTAIAAIAFTFHWGNFLDALLYVQRSAEATLPLGVGELASLDPTELPLMLAGAVVLSLPPVLALLAAQRWLLAAVDVTSDR